MYCEQKSFLARNFSFRILAFLPLKFAVVFNIVSNIILTITFLLIVHFLRCCFKYLIFWKFSKLLNRNRLLRLKVQPWIRIHLRKRIQWTDMTRSYAIYKKFVNFLFIKNSKLKEKRQCQCKRVTIYVPTPRFWLLTCSFIQLAFRACLVSIMFDFWLLFF